MRLSLLNLISTPVPVLNSLGLDLRVGLSSEDPMVVRHPSEPYEAYLSVYSPEGVFLNRSHLGRIPENGRRTFDVSLETRKSVPELDHLAVVHRVPTRLVDQVSSLDDEIELPHEPDYSFFRSMVEYSFPQGSNGSVIYETPPRLNAGASSNSLTFTNQIVLSQDLNTYLVLINHSVDPSYSRIAKFFFGVHCLSGDLALSDTVSVGPFGIQILDMRRLIPEHLVKQEEDPQDGFSWFTFVGGCEDAALMVLAVNISPELRAVAVEHTHPPQTYLLPKDLRSQSRVKVAARSIWRSLLNADSDA